MDTANFLDFMTADGKAEPGIYRVIYKKSDQSYVGVTVKKDAGNTVEACTANAPKPAAEPATKPGTSSAKPASGK